MGEMIDAVKRFIVVLYTELLFFVLGAGILYTLYMKCNTVSDITAFLNNPINPITLCIIGIGALGGGYIGVKMWENLKSNGGNTNGQQSDKSAN